jgi:hypothetical protein
VGVLLPQRASLAVFRPGRILGDVGEGKFANSRQSLGGVLLLVAPGILLLQGFDFQRERLQLLQEQGVGVIVQPLTTSGSTATAVPLVIRPRATEELPGPP